VLTSAPNALESNSPTLVNTNSFHKVLNTNSCIKMSQFVETLDQAQSPVTALKTKIERGANSKVVSRGKNSKSSGRQKKKKNSKSDTELDVYFSDTDTDVSLPAPTLSEADSNDESSMFEVSLSPTLLTLATPGKKRKTSTREFGYSSEEVLQNAGGVLGSNPK